MQSSENYLMPLQRAERVVAQWNSGDAKRLVLLIASAIQTAEDQAVLRALESVLEEQERGQ